MASVRYSGSVSAIKGCLQGSVLHPHQQGNRIYTRNMSKRGRTWKHFQETAIMASTTSFWRSLTPMEQASWHNPRRRKPKHYGGGDTTGPQTGATEFGLFTYTNSKLASIKIPRSKPPPTYGGAAPFTYFYSWSIASDLSVCSVTRGGAAFDDMLFFWAGPYFPIWRTLPPSNHTTIYIQELHSGSYTLDFSGTWQIHFGNLPAAPGYIYFGCQAMERSPLDPTDWSIQTTLDYQVFPVNGAPPYKT